MILLICSALISGSEVAYFSLSPTDMDGLENEKSGSADRAMALLHRPHRLLATILIANNFVNIAIVILSSFILIGGFNFDAYPPWVAVAIQVGVVTFLLLLLGEVIPKVYATSNAMRLIMLMALPLTVMLKVFYPISSLLISSTNLINKRIKKRQSDYSVDELEHALELTKDEQTTPDEEKILKGIVRFGNTDVKQIMKPRTEMVSFDFTTSYAELMDELLDEGFSRVPVYKESLDQVVGILYLKDLLPYSESTDLDWQTLLRAPYFVPENKKLDDLLKEFQSRKVHMAVVVDEYGGTSGIVTLEDIIEEIVGDITDEFDDEDIFYSKLDEQNYIFEGKTPLVDLYKILDISGENFEEAKGESDTLAGFMLELSGRLLVKNEKVNFENYVLTVEAADKRRIKRVKLTLLQTEETEEKEKNR
ncbi:gliding motility-associated protein GldE [Cryomorpha ignava]|uniref:Gliding motility-associated protein GldE n=1 Tax=Cryomorpha ignava TaxID=101383 RepID=A0A7K3WP16_9FLAO|nr:gliding motility-associated protein GldE [Cryomorpha ignava]